MWKWLWFLDYLVERQGNTFLPELGLCGWGTCVWDGGWCDDLGWCWGRQAGTSLAWDQMIVLWREKRHGTCCVSNQEAQCCEEMVREENVGELCKKCLKGWSIEAVCCTCLPVKFCVSPFHLSAPYGPALGLNPFFPPMFLVFLLQNTSLNLGETMSMWRQSCGAMWSSQCCDPKGHSHCNNLPSHTKHGWRGHKPSKGICNFITEGEESLPGLSPGNPLNFVSFF